MARRPPVAKPVSPAAAAEQPVKKPPASRRAGALKDMPAPAPEAPPTPEVAPPPAPTPMAAPAPAPAAKPPGRLFSVTRSRGSAWESTLPQEQQADWADHAAFMNGLEAEGFVVLGGPLEETPYTLLAIRADGVVQVRDRLAQDPWETSRVLETTRIVGWTLALGDGKI